jgi:hypothetical protein
LLNTAATAVFYWLPIKSVWKGREYDLPSFGNFSLRGKTEEEE